MRLAVGATLVVLGLIVGAGYFTAHGNERLVSLLGRGGS
jgi:hypothetical protein